VFTESEYQMALANQSRRDSNFLEKGIMFLTQVHGQLDKKGQNMAILEIGMQ